VRVHSPAGWLALAAFFIFVFGWIGGVRAADENLLLEILINGHAVGRIGEFVSRNGALFARPAELADLGLKVSDDVPKTTDGLVALSSLAGVKARLDQPTQTLYFEAGMDRLLPNVLQVRQNARGIPVESGTGVTLNYDVLETVQSGHAATMGEAGVRIFSPFGVASTTTLGFLGQSPLGPGTSTAIRLDSAYTYSDADELRRYTAGDFINGGLMWTRPVRLGGLQFSHDFAMRPDLITFPVPSLSGTAAVPSAIDVLVNGTQTLSREVQAGPFQVPQLPVVTGAGTASLTVTNALGQQVTTTLPFYASASLLSPGLDTFSFEGGFVRRDWGLISNNYGGPAGSATYRRGISDKITLEGHAEGTSGLAMGGAGIVANTFDLGVVNLAVGGSGGYGRSGWELSVGAQRIAPVFNFGVFAQFTTPHFSDLASINGDPPPRRQLSANFGLSLGEWGSFAVGYASVDRDPVLLPTNLVTAPTSIAGTATSPGEASAANRGFDFLPAEHAHILSANYSVQIHSVSLYANAFRDFQTGNAGISIGLTVPLGERSSISASANGDTTSSAYGQVQAQQTAIVPGDWGYQAYASAGTNDHEFAQAQYKSSWGLFSAGVDRLDRQPTLRGEADGALSFTDGALFASNRITDSFAVVDTHGVAGVHVLSENRDMGKTSSDGKLLVPELRAYDANHLAIDPLDIPPDASLAYTTKDVRPQDRSGVVVDFPVRQSHGALLLLVDKAGRPLPVGSAATLAATGATVAVGYDGQAYVEDLSEKNSLTVQMPDGRKCAALFAYHAEQGDIPKIGPLSCNEANP